MSKRVWNVAQNRGWKSERRFRLWVAVGALRGALLHQNGAVDSGLEGLLGTAIVFDLWGLVLFVVLLPVALLRGISKNRRQKTLEADLDELDPASERYLSWDKRNFLWRASQIKGVVFSNRSGRMTWISGDFQRMQLELEDGQSWRFTLATRLEADQIEEALRAEGFAVSRR